MSVEKTIMIVATAVSAGVMLSSQPRKHFSRQGALIGAGNEQGDHHIVKGSCKGKQRARGHRGHDDRKRHAHEGHARYGATGRCGAGQNAADRVRERLAQFICALDGCGADATQFAGGVVTSPTTQRSFNDVVRLAYAQRMRLIQTVGGNSHNLTAASHATVCCHAVGAALDFPNLPMKADPSWVNRPPTVWITLFDTIHRHRKSSAVRYAARLPWLSRWSASGSKNIGANIRPCVWRGRERLR